MSRPSLEIPWEMGRWVYGNLEYEGCGPDAPVSNLYSNLKITSVSIIQLIGREILLYII